MLLRGAAVTRQGGQSGGRARRQASELLQIKLIAFLVMGLEIAAEKSKKRSPKKSVTDPSPTPKKGVRSITHGYILATAAHQCTLANFQCKHKFGSPRSAQPTGAAALATQVHIEVPGIAHCPQRTLHVQHGHDRHQAAVLQPPPAPHLRDTAQQQASATTPAGCQQAAGGMPAG